MQRKSCSICDHEKVAQDGICSDLPGEDGYRVRCVREWSFEKLAYLRKYIEMVSTSMRNNPKWSNLCYIDLFTGPGICRVRTTGEEIDGSALIALKTKYPFNRYFFVDRNKSACEILEKRLQKICKDRNIDFKNRTTIFQDDCNKIARDIKQSLPARSLSICFIDPTGFQTEFKTIEALTSGGIRIDLIINFPYGYGLKRNIENFYNGSSQTMDAFWGDESWRRIYEKLPKGASDERFTRTFIEAFQEKLVSLGYLKGNIGDVIKIKHYYALIVAGKDPLVQKFLKEIARRDPYGQEKLL